jgi:hypothetical protein
MTKESEDIEFYGDTRIASGHAPIPSWLKWVYVILPIQGLLIFYLFWNGSSGWLDRGYWLQLQKAANTTFPQINYLDTSPDLTSEDVP